MIQSQRISRRTRVIQGQGVTTVVIKPKGRLGSVLFAIPVLAFWTFGGLFAGLMLMVERDDGGSGAFFMIWLTAWFFAEVFGVIYILWKLLGRIVVRVTPAEVVVSHRILGIGPSVRLPATSTSGMDWTPDDKSTTVKVNGRRIPQSALRIRAIPQMITIARDISRDDAEAVMAACSSRVPRWGRRSLA